MKTSQLSKEYQNKLTIDTNCNKLTYDNDNLKYNYLCMLDTFCIKYFNSDYIFSIPEKKFIEKKTTVKDILNKIFKNKNIFILFSKFNFENNILSIDSDMDAGLFLLKSLEIKNVDPCILIEIVNGSYVFTPNIYFPAHWVSFVRDLINEELEIIEDNFNSETTSINKNKSILTHENKSNYILNMPLENLEKIIINMLSINSQQISFKVLQPNFAAIKENALCESFSKYASYKHSFMGYFFVLKKGGFTFDAHHTNDPLTELIKQTGNLSTNMFDINGTVVFEKQENVNLWYFLMVYFWMKQFGIQISELTML